MFPSLPEGLMDNWRKQLAMRTIRFTFVWDNLDALFNANDDFLWNTEVFLDKSWSIFAPVQTLHGELLWSSLWVQNAPNPKICQEWAWHWPDWTRDLHEQTVRRSEGNPECSARGSEMMNDSYNLWTSCKWRVLALFFFFCRIETLPAEISRTTLKNDHQMGLSVGVQIQAME